ncbi:hypothetical protein KFE25_014375 [Diacronema lutheri]|uniref:Uncharacterized protein n=1 Tax=Diacronema lutheri TaxID=2081491 RepID=A0A8J5XFD3_DIALT|nr:hypothetical protein KFE25_014375 [Diacronema lutheri]
MAKEELDEVEAAVLKMVQQPRRGAARSQLSSLDGAPRARSARAPDTASAVASACMRASDAQHSEAIASLAGALRDGQLRAPAGAATRQLQGRLTALQAKLSELHARESRPGTPALVGGRGDDVGAAFGEAVADFTRHAEPSLRCTALASIRLQLAHAIEHGGGGGADDGGSLRADVLAATPVVSAGLEGDDVSVFAAALDCLPVLVKAALPAHVASAHAVAALRRPMASARARAELSLQLMPADHAEAATRSKASRALASIGAADVPSALALVAETLGASLPAACARGKPPAVLGFRIYDPYGSCEAASGSC